MDYHITATEAGPKRGVHVRSDRNARLSTRPFPAGGEWCGTEVLLGGFAADILAAIIAHADTHNFTIAGTTVHVSALSGGRPLRLTQIHLHYRFPAVLGDQQLDDLKAAARNSLSYLLLAAAAEIHTATTQVSIVDRQESDVASAR